MAEVPPLRLQPHPQARPETEVGSAPSASQGSPDTWHPRLTDRAVPHGIRRDTCPLPKGRRSWGQYSAGWGPGLGATKTVQLQQAAGRLSVPNGPPAGRLKAWCLLQAVERASRVWLLGRRTGVGSLDTWVCTSSGQISLIAREALLSRGPICEQPPFA